MDKQIKEKLEKLKLQNKKEYQTRGNTQRCQELWKQIEELEKELKKRG